MGASRLYAIFGGSQNLKQRSLSEAVSLFQKTSFDKLSRQREGYKYSLARSFAFGLMGQPRATVYRFFNL